MRRYKAKSPFLIKIQGAEFGIADADGLLKHGRKDRLKIAGGTTDNLKHLRRRRLPLQRLPQFVEQPRVLDGDNGLGGEVGE